MRLTDEELDTLEAQAATWDAPLLPPGAWHCQSIDGALAKKAVAELRAARARIDTLQDGLDAAVSDVRAARAELAARTPAPEQTCTTCWHNYSHGIVPICGTCLRFRGLRDYWTGKP
jgi:hypothetical protein